jgi:hypothetical protein
VEDVNNNFVVVVEGILDPKGILHKILFLFSNNVPKQIC